MKEPEQEYVMGVVGGAADRVLRQHQAIAAVDRGEGGGQHADIGLAAGQDERVDRAGAKPLTEPRRGEGGIAVLVEDQGRRHELRQHGHQLQQPWIQHPPRHLRPAGVIAPPAAGQLVRLPGRQEAGEDGVLRPVTDEAAHHGRGPLRPRHMPGGLLRKQLLHVDAEMDRPVPQPAERQRLVGCHGGIAGDGAREGITAWAGRRSPAARRR